MSAQDKALEKTQLVFRAHRVVARAMKKDYEAFDDVVAKMNSPEIWCIKAVPEMERLFRRFAVLVGSLKWKETIAMVLDKEHKRSQYFTIEAFKNDWIKTFDLLNALSAQNATVAINTPNPGEAVEARRKKFRDVVLANLSSTLETTTMMYRRMMPLFEAFAMAMPDVREDKKACGQKLKYVMTESARMLELYKNW